MTPLLSYPGLLQDTPGQIANVSVAMHGHGNATMAILDENVVRAADTVKRPPVLFQNIHDLSGIHEGYGTTFILCLSIR